MIKEQYDEDFHGGMYNLLKLIDKLLFKAKHKEVTRKEIMLFCPHVSETAVSNNLRRLVKAGLLEMQENRDSNNYNCRVVAYKIKGDDLNDIRKSLYN